MAKTRGFGQAVVDTVRMLGRWINRYPVPIVGYGITVLVIASILLICLNSPAAKSVKIIESLLLIIFLFACWFVMVFTGPATDKKVNWMICYCYGVTLCLLTSFSVFFFFPVYKDHQPTFQWPEFGGPVGIVLGCTMSPKVDYVRETSDTEQSKVRSAFKAGGFRSVGEDGIALDEAAPVERYRSVTPKWLPKEIECGNNTQQWLLNVGGKVEPPPVVARTVVENTRAEMFVRAAEKDSLSSVPEDNTPHTRIQGGLVVPLYFVVIALIGGLVSIMRRIPEYQARVGPNAADRLTNEEARERLVFQLMQVLSAPLIAATAYYLVDPSTRTTSIALAFIAGFSSETVLLYIRALTTKLQPEAQDRVPIIVSPTNLAFGKVRVKNESAPANVVLHNRGTSAVKIASIVVKGDWTYLIDGRNAAADIVIAPGTSMMLEVSFKPMQTGAQHGTITITDGEMGSPRIIALSGEGSDDGATSKTA
jgi:hypothetical protein